MFIVHFVTSLDRSGYLWHIEIKLTLKNSTHINGAEQSIYLTENQTGSGTQNLRGLDSWEQQVWGCKWTRVDECGQRSSASRSVGILHNLAFQPAGWSQTMSSWLVSVLLAHCYGVPLVSLSSLQWPGHLL